MRFGDGSDKGTASHFVRISGKVRREESMAVHGKSKITETEKGETDEEQGDYSQRIYPGMPNSQFCSLL
jgi:hypothetical protein